MAKKPEPAEPEEESAPAWFVSYADMVTLLMCFFVILYSMATADKPKFSAVAKSFRDGFMPHSTQAAASSFKNEPRGNVTKTIDLIAQEGEDKGQTVVDPRDIIVIGGPVFFEKGSSELKADQYSSLYRIAMQLRGTNQIIEIHGYCSPDPEDESIKYNNKWELSFFRATSVIEFLTDPNLGKISQERIRIYVHGEYDFRNTLLFTQNRKERQRVEIITSPTKSTSIKDTEEAK
jgi:chemotaxis protein MotB